MSLASVTSFFAQAFDYNTQGIGFLAASLISFSVGLLVLYKDPHSSPHRSFFLSTLAGAIWLFGTSLELLSHLESQAYACLSLAYIGIPFISPSVYLFSIEWTQSKNKRRIAKWGFILGGFQSLVTFFFTKEIFAFNYFEWGRYDTFHNTPFGIGFFSFILVVFSVYGIMAGVNIFKAMKAADSPNQRLQFRNFLIAFFVGYAGSLDFLNGFVWKTYPFSYVFYTGFILIVAYSILRHHFLDVNLIVKRTALILVIYTVLLALLLPVTLPILNNLLNNSLKNPIPSVLCLSFGIGIVLSLGPLIYAFLVRHSYWLHGHTSQGLAHELKSPVSAILGSLEVLTNRKVQRGESSLNQHLDIIKKNAERLEQFTNSLLDVAKIQDGSLELDRVPFDLADVLQAQIKNQAPLVRGKGLSLSADIPPSQPFSGDLGKINQVVSNLLSNAIKFSDKGAIKIALAAKNSHLECAVTDQGRGIAAKDLNRIFDRFYQGKNASKGSGIGLAIAKAWVETHGGRIWAESEGEGKGTKVTFTLPL